ncbi:ArsR/SmtB family transcription factor [Paenibacillus sp. GYB003]|uniref:ArsR/SmtB family transcription factor n=1 Tax=Paenibacillus sp. GYB003 TaxID=2994392 RepID=UPI002F96A4D5
MLDLSLDEPERLKRVAHALSSDVRIGIIKLLNENKMNIVDIADRLGLPVSTVALNVKVLEQTGLILTETVPAKRGTMKVCSRNFDLVRMKLYTTIGNHDPKNCYTVEMPIGHFTDCDIAPTCGMAVESGIVEPKEEPSVFYEPERVDAQLIWFRSGYVEYKFPAAIPGQAGIRSIQFSFELCSEAPTYDHEFPSDITVWINGVEIGTWTCPGDFGDRRGRLNPAWVPYGVTQYGLLKTWKVNRNGTYLDDMKLSDVALGELDIRPRRPIRLKIGVKADAVHIGGLNLFGKKLGDHEQDIVMRILYE